MGAGKDYLTFALHEYLTQNLHLDVDMKGVESRPDLVLKINEIIKTSNLKGLEFVESSIEAYLPEKLEPRIPAFSPQKNRKALPPSSTQPR